MKVIIPVAGAGMRMRPHTNTRPKPLLSLAGRPGIAFILDELQSLDVSEVIFITGHLKEKIEDYIRTNYSFKARFIEQKKLDGTAGAVLLAEEYIDEPVLIIFVDTVFDADLSLIKRLKKDESGIIWVKEVEDYSRFGVCVLDGGYLKKIVEKPIVPISRLANIGLYYVKDYKALYESIHHLFYSKKMLNGEYYLTDAFMHMVEGGSRFLCPEVSGWFDFGKKETALESNRQLLKRFNTPPGEVECNNSVIIPPVHVAKDVLIEDSVVGPFVSVEKGSCIKHSVVKDSIIFTNSRIECALLDKSIISESCIVRGSFKSLSLGADSVIKGQD